MESALNHYWYSRDSYDSDKIFSIRDAIRVKKRAIRVGFCPLSPKNSWFLKKFSYEDKLWTVMCANRIQPLF